MRHAGWFGVAAVTLVLAYWGGRAIVFAQLPAEPVVPLEWLVWLYAFARPAMIFALALCARDAGASWTWTLLAPLALVAEVLHVLETLPGGPPSRLMDAAPGVMLVAAGWRAAHALGGATNLARALGGIYIGLKLSLVVVEPTRTGPPTGFLLYFGGAVLSMVLLAFAVALAWKHGTPKWTRAGAWLGVAGIIGGIAAMAWFESTIGSDMPATFRAVAAINLSSGTSAAGAYLVLTGLARATRPAEPANV